MGVLPAYQRHFHCEKHSDIFRTRQKKQRELQQLVHNTILSIKCSFRLGSRPWIRFRFYGARLTYAHLGATPIMRGGLYGLGPVVLGIFIVAVYRLSKSEVSTLRQMMIALTAAAAVAFSPVGIASALALAAGVGILLFHSFRAGALILVVLIAFLATANFGSWVSLSPIVPDAQATASPHLAGLAEI